MSSETSYKIAALLKEAVRRKKHNERSFHGERIWEIVPDYRRWLENTKIKYLCFKGGRGSGKTLSIVAFLIEQSYSRIYAGKTFLCCREIQTNIQSSVYSVITDQINKAGLQNDFVIRKTVIINKKTGVMFKFRGLRSTGGDTAASQLDSLKGMSGVAIVFVDEAATISEASLSVLFPTVNRDSNMKLDPAAAIKLGVSDEKKVDLVGARFFFAMNPIQIIDPVIKKLDSFGDEAKVLHRNIDDLPPEFQDAQLMRQMAQEKDNHDFGHVWKGEPWAKYQGAPFAKHKWLSEQALINAGATMVAQAAWLDPAHGGEDSTALSIHVLIKDQEGNTFDGFFGYTWRQAWNDVDDQIADILHSMGLNDLFYESNGAGTSPKDNFRALKINATARHTSLNKIKKIVRGAAQSRDHIYFLEFLGHSQWHYDVKSYTVDTKHDDSPDSFVSLADELRIVKLEDRVYGSK
ncbi:TPA: phage terminase large subunit [Vibrio harveyi]|nr:phage terminase large subunit [Vibrio harveyi]